MWLLQRGLDRVEELARRYELGPDRTEDLRAMAIDAMCEEDLPGETSPPAACSALRCAFEEWLQEFPELQQI